LGDEERGYATGVTREEKKEKDQTQPFLGSQHCNEVSKLTGRTQTNLRQYNRPKKSNTKKKCGLEKKPLQIRFELHYWGRKKRAQGERASNQGKVSNSQARPQVQKDEQK